jgi:hypothetical protein
MRTLLSVVALTVGLGLGAATTSAAQSPVQDSVTGSATTGIGRNFAEYTFDVHSGPSGENPTGTVVFASLFGVIGPLDVTCLSVSGNRASMIVRFPEPNTSTTVGLEISVEDNGPAQDRIDPQPLTALPSACPVPSEVSEPTLSGDIVVTDAQPFPTTADQCRHGGWHDFGFKNEGECIAFVNHAHDCRIVEHHGDHPHACPPRPPAPPHE